jgi:hypothetical protein
MKLNQIERYTIGKIDNSFTDHPTDMHVRVLEKEQVLYL